MPEAHWIQGPDLNYWRQYVNWYRVAADEAGHQFAITKATQGDKFVDPTFDENWAGMRRVGLIRGAYHYFRPEYDPVKQADHFLRVMEGINHAYDLPLILDVERGNARERELWRALGNTNARLNHVRRGLERLEQRTGRQPILYTNLATWREYFGDSSSLSRYPLWIANYGVNQPNVPGNNWGGQGWSLWQFTESGVVDGVNEGDPPTDINWFPGTVQQMRTRFVLSNLPPLPEVEYLNRDLLDAFNAIARRFNMSPQTMLGRAGLLHIDQNSFKHDYIYGGPPLEELPNLTPDMLAALQEQLANVNRTPTDLGVKGLANQDVINAFYRAAAKFNTNGNVWLGRLDLLEITEERQRIRPYRGPRIQDMHALTTAEQDALKSAIGVLDFEPDPGDIVPTYPDKDISNQDMINAFYKAAGDVNQSGWSWILRAHLTHMADSQENRIAPYTGPLIEDLPNLTLPEKVSLKAALELEVAPPEPPAEPTYPNLENQDIINIFFRAAATLNEAGWNWIVSAGLTYMAIPQENRRKPYTGPRMEDLPHLSDAQKGTLLQALLPMVDG